MPFGLLADLRSDRAQWRISATLDAYDHTPHLACAFLHEIEGNDTWHACSE